MLPNFDTETVEGVVDALHDADKVPQASEVGPGRELVTLERRAGAQSLFAALERLTTVRVNAVRAQSPVPRLLKLGRALTNDEIDPGAGKEVRKRLVHTLQEERDVLAAAGVLQALVNSVLTVAVRTLGIDHVQGLATSAGRYAVATASADLAAQFERSGRSLSNGLHMDWWQAHPERDADEVKAELIVLTRHPGVMERLEAVAQQDFDQRHQAQRGAIRGLAEVRRQHYERLRLADARPVPEDWVLPPNIAYRRKDDAAIHERHLYVEADGKFRSDLNGWEQEVLQRMLCDVTVVGWLRNPSRQPWSLEVDVAASDGLRPMFPDLVFIRQVAGALLVDVLDPHDPSLDDNVDKARALAVFAEAHASGIARMGLVRKMRVAAGTEAMKLLDCAQPETRRRVRLLTTPQQLDQLFEDRAETLAP